MGVYSSADEGRVAQSAPRGRGGGQPPGEGRAARARHSPRDRAGDPWRRAGHRRSNRPRRRDDRAAPGHERWQCEPSRCRRRGDMRCRKCGDAAVLELRRHNAAFCARDFLEFFRNQVREAVRKYRMFTRDEPVLVAVSGGKDSLALWDVLIDEDYRTTGLYLDLGIYDYSVESKAKCETFAAAHGVPLIVVSVAD